MSQTNVDFSNDMSGVELLDDYLTPLKENINTSNSGIQRPSYAVAGTKWLDTSVTPWLWKMYDGTSDITLGTVDSSTHLFTPANILPSQDGQSGKFLQTNGTSTVWTDAVDYTNKANCITKIPQDIKLELNNGTLTLKAGSKVYKGDGNVINIDSDKVLSQGGTNTNAVMFIRIDTNSFISTTLKKTFSGDTPPDSPTNLDLWYDTANKMVKVYSKADSAWYECTFPFGLFSNSNSSVTSIDQVFNGFGYIGSTVFALPGVEGLIPNGFVGESRNNIKFKTSSVLTQTVPAEWGNPSYFAVDNYGFSIYAQYSEDGPVNGFRNQMWYDSRENLLKATRDNLVNIDVVKRVYFLRINHDSGRITSFNPKATFHAADYQDVPKLAADNTFTGINKIRHSKGIFQLESNVYDWKEQSSSFSTPAKVYFADKNSILNGFIQTTKLTNNSRTCEIGVRNQSDTEWNVMGVGYDPNGNKYTFAPTPPTSDNSTQIATTAWFNSQKQNIISWGIPNYSAGVAKSKDVDYTAESCGYLLELSNASARSDASKIIVNNVTVATIGLTGTAGGIMWSAAFVNKGDRYRFAGVNSTSRTFFPLRGA